MAILSWVQSANDIPSVIAEVGQFDIMHQVILTFLLLLDLGDPIVLSEYESWIEGLGKYHLCAQTFVFNATTIKFGPIFQFLACIAIVEIIVSQGTVPFEERLEGIHWLRPHEFEVQLQTKFQIIIMISFFNDVIF